MKKITTVIVNEVLWNHLSSKTLHLLSAMHKIKVVSVLLKYPKGDFNLLSSFHKVNCVIKGQLGS